MQHTHTRTLYSYDMNKHGVQMMSRLATCSGAILDHAFSSDPASCPATAKEVVVKGHFQRTSLQIPPGIPSLPTPDALRLRVEFLGTGCDRTSQRATHSRGSESKLMIPKHPTILFKMFKILRCLSMFKLSLKKFQVDLP